jgi:hypothetical protein
MLQRLRRRQDARRLAQADAEALIATTAPRPTGKRESENATWF